MSDRRTPVDPLTQATITVAWVIFLNKPFYPLYVWYLVGNGVNASLGTLFAAPFFLALPYLARRSPVIARMALPLVGALDTLFETKLFGQGSGTELFYAACIMLVALSFRAKERWLQRGMAAVIFAVFLISRSFAAPPLHIWSDADLAILLNLNIFAVASLLAFIAIRYAGIADRGEPHRPDDR
jgi:hypothetical protein